MTAEPLVLLQTPSGVATRAQQLLGEGRAMLDDVPHEGAFSLWARGQRCAEALKLAMHEGERVQALVLEAPTDVDAESVAEVKAATLVVCGSDADASLGRALRQRLSNCHLVLVYATGDDVANQRPEAFADLVRDFLARRERFIVSNRGGLLHP